MLMLGGARCKLLQLFYSVAIIRFMYVVPVKIAKSEIDGHGVFEEVNIAKGTVVWKHKDGYDLTLTTEEYESSSAERKSELEKTAYLSPWSGLWVFPTGNDPAQYTNHSPNNNLSVVYDESISSEPYCIANKDIEAGEELTNNYHEFDKLTQQTKPLWAK